MTGIVVPDLSAWASEAVLRGTDPQVARDELLAAIRQGVEAHPRSAQKEIGPSEVGHPCDRWLAHRLAGTVPAVPETTPWRQSVGTAVHTYVEDLLHRYNETVGFRYLTDLRVCVGELYPGRPIAGTLDILDVATATVVDVKVPGPTGMKNYGKPGKPEKPQYKRQKHLYARGAARAGFPVDQVAILRLPAAGEFTDADYKVEPYDEQIAVDALTRCGGIARMVDALGAKAAPLLAPTEADCHRCEFYKPRATDLTHACPGHPDMRTRTGRASSKNSPRDGLEDLIERNPAA